MKLADLARAAAAFTLAWAAFAQLPGTHAHDAGDAAPAWPISHPRIHRPLPPTPPPAIVPVVEPIAITAVVPAAIPAAARR